MDGYVVILKYCLCYLDSNQDIPSTPVSCVNGDSKDKNQHWAQKQWPSKVALKPGDKNVVRDSLIDPKKYSYHLFI
jgi:hypothetical protein